MGEAAIKVQRLAAVGWIAGALALACTMGGGAVAQPVDPSTAPTDDGTISPQAGKAAEDAAAAAAAAEDARPVQAPVEPVGAADNWKVAEGHNIYVLMDALQMKIEANGFVSAWVT